MKYFLSITFLFLSAFLFAQKGTIRGTVIDNETGESLVGVTVYATGTTNGTITDLDGKFSLQIAAGNYNLQVSYISYQTVNIEGLEVTEGEVTLVDNIRLHISKQEIDEVVITAEAVRTTETALITIKKKAPSILDGISSARIQLTGDATAVEAAKRVTGVSIEGGKYVYIRGLGDRYSKTTMNGVDIPGLDPDRNTIQMDIFPTNLIANILVSKNFTADQPADFTGGLLNIETKDFPNKKIFDVSFGASYSPGVNFSSDYLTYKGGSLDFLGIDDGTRRLPAGADQSIIPSPVSGNSSTEVNDFISSFSPTLGGSNQFSLMDFSAGISLGNQVDLASKENDAANSRKLGYIFSLTYKSDYEYYNDVTYGEYQRDRDPDVYDMNYATITSGELGKRNFLVGMLGGIAYKTNYSKLRLTAMHLQSGESSAGIFEIDNSPDAIGQSGYQATSYNLLYTQRSLTNLILAGTRKAETKGWEIDWRISPTLSISNDPDIRKTAFTNEFSGPSFSAGAGGNPSRIWRNLNEWNVAGLLDLSKDYALGERNGKLKVGGGHTFKLRNYEIITLDMLFFGDQPDWTGTDPAQVLDPANIYPNGSVYFQSGNTSPNSNQYSSNVNNTALYLSNELELFPRLKSILGVRMENYVQRHTGRDIQYAQSSGLSGNNLDNDKVLSSLDFFPSANFIYSLTDNQNLRASYSQTIARPSFKELSYAQIIDPVTNRIFNGALFEYPDWDGVLVETNINNLDLRWELFMQAGQLLSISGFYKNFANPIELVRIPTQQTSTEYQPRNVGEGQLYGLELEFRKSLNFIAEALKDFSLSGNFTYVESFITMTDAEYNSRLGYEKTSETIGETRQMAGQAPYVINASLSYSNYEKALDFGVFYNVKGPTLVIVGGGLFPDIYQEPFHSLNFSANKRFGKDNHSSIDIKFSNILNDVDESYYYSYNAAAEIYERMSPIRSFSIGYSRKF